MGSLLFDQNYSGYQEEDHQTWKTLCGRQLVLRKENISTAYLTGFKNLELDHSRIARIDVISSRLKSISGWTLIPVAGLIPTRDFFTMMIDKKYPITVSIRKPWQMDFIDHPDIFHDVCGHVPLLTNLEFVNFLANYSLLALKYLDDDRAVNILSRLYWFTCEMGVIVEQGAYKAYGGAVITSAQEIVNINNTNVPKYPFTLDQILNTSFDYSQLQTEYFVINSYDELFNSLINLEKHLLEHIASVTKIN
jgi:phenylalanine-4-hydroxylase